MSTPARALGLSVAGVAAAAGAYFAPSSMEIYRAETALRASELELERVKALAATDTSNYSRANSRWSSIKQALMAKREAYKRSDQAFTQSRQVYLAAKRAYEEAETSRRNASTELSNAERENEAATKDLEIAKAKLGTHDVAIQRAKTEVDRLTRIAEEKIKLLKLPL